MIVCLVGDNNDIRAGWGRLLTEVGQALEKAGHQVMYCIRSGTPDEKTSVFPMHVLSLFRPIRFLRSACRLRSAFRKADILHVFDVNPYGVLTTLAATGLKKPIILNANRPIAIVRSGPTHLFATHMNVSM